MRAWPMCGPCSPAQGAAETVRRTGRRGGRLLIAAALLAIPFGSYAELEQRIIDGTITASVPQGRFIVHGRDDNGYVSWRVAELKQVAPTLPAVYLFGGSSVRECIVGQDGLGASIRDGCGRDVTVTMLASSMQDYPRTLAIIDNLPAAEGGIVVIGVHHCTFASPRSRAIEELRGVRLMMKSPALHDLVARRLACDVSNNLRRGLEMHLENYRASRGVAPFRGRSLAFLPHRYSRSDLCTSAVKRLCVRRWLAGKGRRGGEFDSYFSFNAACLSEAVELARAKGFEVVLMECPLNGAIVGHAFDRYKRTYRALCQELVAEQGAHYFNVNQSAGLVNTDFCDLYHLVKPGRAKWQNALAMALSPIVAGLPEPPAAPTPALLPGSAR